MKILSYILVVILLLTACDKSVLDTPNSHSIMYLTPNVTYPLRSQGTRGASTNDNWEKWETIKLPSGKTVYTPWNKVSSSSIPQDVREDIKASNGWKLIAYTIAGPNETVRGDAGLNYMLFYNKYTGILKVFYYLESGSLQNTAMWKLHFETPQSLLAFADEYARITSNKSLKDVYVSNITNSDTKAFEVGWNCFQIELAYDPDFTKGSMQIIPMSINTSNVVIEGKAISETKGTIISSTSNPLSGAVKAIASGAGKDAEDFVKDKIKDGKLKGYKNLIVNGAGAIATSGVSSLLGSFVGGFLKGGQTSQTVQLHTDTKIKLTAEMKSVSSGIINPLTISLSTKDVGRLGVWCLTKEPVKYLLPYVRYKGKWYSQDWYVYEVQTLTDLMNNDKIVVNPEILSEIAGKNVSIKIDTYLRNKKREQALGSHGYSLYSQMIAPETIDLLYEDTYKGEGASFMIAFPVRNKNNVIIKNLATDKIPKSAYIPNAPNGAEGVDDNANCDSNIKYVYTIEYTLPDGNTICSSHTFIPKLQWDMRQFQSDMSYKFMYPGKSVNE